MNHLTRNDFAGALSLLAQLQPHADDGAAAFARHAVVALTGYVAADLSTLSVCDLRTGHRQVAGQPGSALSAADVETFDRHFHAHPLVRFHGYRRQPPVRRLSDEVSLCDFRRTALYADYYRRIGIDHVIALPLLMDGHTLVSFVMNRARLDFSERERERLELLRPHLAWLYRQACRATRDRLAAGVPSALDDVAPLPDMLPAGLAPRAGLTPREWQVMHWLAGGKTDAEIAALLGLSPRTVQKHLQHVYIKLGVETRTAAVMRSLSASNKGSEWNMYSDMRLGLSGTKTISP